MVQMMKVERVRDAITKTAKLLARDKVKVQQRGGQPHVMYDRDGKVQYINLPMIPDDPSQELLNAIQGFLDHEVAHVLFTDKLAEYAGIERAKKAGLPLQSVVSMSNIFEDVRIEKKMRVAYQGSARNLTTALEFVLDKQITPALADADKIADPDKRSGLRRAQAMVPYMRARSGDANAEKWLVDNHLIDDVKAYDAAFPTLVARLKALETTADTIQLAIDFVEAITPKEPEPEEQPEEDDGTPPPSLGEREDGESDDGDPTDGEDEGPEGDEDEDDDFEPDEWDEDDDFEEDPDLADDGDDGDDDDFKENDGDDKPDQGDDGEEEDGGMNGEDGGDDTEQKGKGDQSSEGKQPDKGENGEEEGEDEEDEDDAEGSGGEKNDVTLTDAMRMIEPTHRKLLMDYNRNRKSVERLATERGVSIDGIADQLRTARRQLNAALNGELS